MLTVSECKLAFSCYSIRPKAVMCESCNRLSSYRPFPRLLLLLLVPRQICRRANLGPFLEHGLCFLVILIRPDAVECKPDKPPGKPVRGPIGKANIVGPRRLLKLGLEFSSLGCARVVVGCPLVLVLVALPSLDPERWVA